MVANGKSEIIVKFTSIQGFKVTLTIFDLAEIDRVCKDHFKIDWSDFDPRKDKKDKQKIKLSSITTIAGIKTFIEEELL